MAEEIAEDREWIDDNIKDPIHEESGEFEGEIFLSTDGKNTVHVKALTTEGRKASLIWAKTVYDRLIFRYGTKQAQAKREYSDEEKCETCNSLAVKKSGEKNGRKWTGIFCQTNKEHIQWLK
ncbi:MAG: hypothetical protein AABY22_05625 [Nanoarchaeota archaeon]